MQATDEQPHGDAGPDITDVWSFDFAAPDASMGGWIRLAWDHERRRVRYDAYLVREGEQLCAVVDLDVPPPRVGLEIRTTGLWADHICETPFDHWTLGLEAFALGVEDPAEVLGRGFGDQVPFGIDLEWESDGPAVSIHDTAGLMVPDESLMLGYSIDCTVSGEILIGRDEIDFVGTGRRDHTWGRGSWWHTPEVDGSIVGTALLDVDDAAGTTHRLARSFHASNPPGWRIARG